MENTEAKKTTAHPLYLMLNGEDIEGFNIQRSVEKELPDLRGSDFRGVDLRGATLNDIDLSNCYFRQADLRGQDLRSCNLQGASLRAAKSLEPIFQRCYLQMKFSCL